VTAKIRSRHAASLARPRTFAWLLLWLGTAAVGCSSSGDAPLQGDAGPQQVGEQGGSGAPGADAAMRPEQCSGLATPTLLLAGVAASSLRVSGGQLVYVDADAGTGAIAKSRAIRRASVDGTANSVIYEAPANKQVVNLVVDGDVVFFLQKETLEFIGETQLYRVAKSGGTAARVSPASPGLSYDSSQIFGIDAGSVYLQSSSRIVRVSRADGAETVIATLDSQPTDIQLLADTIWYADGHGMFGIYRTPAAASAPLAAARLADVPCGSLGLTVTKDGIFCSAETGIIRLDLEGKNERLVANALELDDNGLVPSLPDGQTLYLYGQGGYEAPTTFYRLPTTGGPPVAVACNRGRIVELTFDPTAIYWVERKRQGAGAVTSIYRLLK